MSTDFTKKPPTLVTSKPKELEHQIRQRAHELYEARGREHGHELEDWFRAEEEMAARNFEPLPPDLRTRHRAENEARPGPDPGPFLCERSGGISGANPRHLPSKTATVTL